MLPKMLKNWLASLIWTFLISQYSIFMATRQLRFQSLHSNHQQSHGCSPLQGLVQGLSQSSTDINRFYRDVHHQNGWPRNNFSIQIFQFYNFNYLSSIYIYSDSIKTTCIHSFKEPPWCCCRSTHLPSTLCFPFPASIKGWHFGKNSQLTVMTTMKLFGHRNPIVASQVFPLKQNGWKPKNRGGPPKSSILIGLEPLFSPSILGDFPTIFGLTPKSLVTCPSWCHRFSFFHPMMPPSPLAKVSSFATPNQRRKPWFRESLLTMFPNKLQLKNWLSH